MKIVAFDPFLTQSRADEMKVSLASTPDEALTGADVVTLHVPMTEETRHILNAERLSLMNQGALVINCARGGLIDEAALKAAIDSGHIAGCGLDVFEDEPPSAEHPLFSLDKHISFTPHLGASTNEAQENVGIQVAEQIRDFCATGEIRNAINMPSMDATALNELGCYIDIASGLGKLLAKIGPDNPDSLRISYHGPISKKDTALISRSVLTSFLEAARNDGQVNIVNSPAIAKEMGLETIESTINAATEYSELVIAELKKGDVSYRVSGTVIGKSPRIVEIDKLYVDINIRGHFLVVKNDDRPGMVGLIGTELGNAKANIANLSLGRNSSEGSALTVIELDAPIESSVMSTIRKTEGVIYATGVTL